jgi:hypothetical protein
MVRELTVSAASRFSRRSFFGRAGRLSAAFAGASTLGAIFAVEEAQAAFCGYNHSVACYRLDGWGQNSCPPESFNNTNTFWTDCNHSLCPHGVIRWWDCCGGCSTTTGVCKPCHCNSSGPSSCCYRGSGTWCVNGRQDLYNCCRKFTCPGTYC